VPRQSLDAYLSLGRLSCPSCRGELRRCGISLACETCHESFAVVDDIPVLLPSETQRSTVKSEIQRFWADLYQAAYAEQKAEHDRETFLELLDELEQMFRHRRHTAVTEMPIRQLSGKIVLEIGCGAGAHSALFARHGAEVASLDLTPDRVLATARKLDWIDTPGHFALQGDAEFLPFRDCCFDLVYSNGALHHTPDTAKAIREVFRVLRPGGRAVIMLYARHSFNYWINLFLIRGILRGAMFRHRNWLGRITEWMAPGVQKYLNPETKVYTVAEVRRLFSQFVSVRVRKYSFNYSLLRPLCRGIPYLGSRLHNRFMEWLERKQGVSRGGIPVYGFPWRLETPSERWLGRWIGFALSISAVKPS
jgi:ubiquinone/menaquinone biosynthesis C-methylase UbiE/uncharacterized protein YbaR (Trm112 family)